MTPGRLAAAGLLIAILGACSVAGAPTPAPGTASPVELTVFGAASLGAALDAAAAAYETATPGVTVTLSIDSSAALATQITEGAPADVFLSADTTNPEKLADAGLADGAPIPFAENELVVITPADDPAGIETPFDLGAPGVRVIAAGDDVPITRYATQLVNDLAADPAAPADFAASYAANIVSKEDNVSAVRTKIELGEGDAAIVYVTDAAASDMVGTVEIPDTHDVRATYAGIVVRASDHPKAARAFLDWFAGQDGQAILAGFGFLPPPA